MPRNEELMLKVLEFVDSNTKGAATYVGTIDIKGYTEDEINNTYMYLKNNGYVEYGNDPVGRFKSFTGLTKSGYDYLEKK